MFLHGGLLHIGGNMLFLWVFGNNVEDRIGRLALRRASTCSAGRWRRRWRSRTGRADAAPLDRRVGCGRRRAGRVSGDVPAGAGHDAAVLFRVSILPAVVVLAGWFVLQVFQGVGSVRGDGGGVAYFAHIGGFVAGWRCCGFFPGVARPHSSAGPAKLVSALGRCFGMRTA